MAIILFYAPFNQRSRDNESLMIAFHQQGHRVMCLSQQEGLQINDFLNSKGITAVSYIVPGKRHGWKYFLKHLVFFIRFCGKNKIDIVYSHLEPANFVASIGQYFIKAKTFLCRHHIDEGHLYNFEKDLYYRLTYRLARRIIVVSDHARKYMIAREHIPARKIKHINLAYDFSLYGTPDIENVKLIRNKFSSEILLVTACRLTEFKRPELAIQLVKKLVDAGANVKLIMLGKGELFEKLLTLTEELDLTERVFLIGYVSNVLDYMKAADFLIHPSLLDSSCVAVKEAALVDLPVVVCKGVGDFDDYIVHGHNGFILDPDRFVEDAKNTILSFSKDRSAVAKVGSQLHRDVINIFDISSVLPNYDPLNVPK